MIHTIFYSWQSDLPNATNRSFVQKALEEAIQAIGADEELGLEPVLDRDTQGAPGAPEISRTIFSKIEACDIFVADISIINSETEGRKVPNPNVLIELGFAMHTVGYERIVLVYNLAFGKIEDIPFDLRSRRAVRYNVGPDAENKSQHRRSLAKDLKVAIQSSLQQVLKGPEVSLPSLAAIESVAPNKKLLLRHDLKGVLEDLRKVQPKKFSKGGCYEDLLVSIEQSLKPVTDFSKIASHAAAMGDLDCVLEITHWLGGVLDEYRFNAPGTFSEADFDYWRFVGHELLVTLVAGLLAEDNLEAIRLVLNKAIPVKKSRSNGRPGVVHWDFASEPVRSMLDRSRANNRMSVHADVLHSRHDENSELHAVTPLDSFLEADFLLFLCGELPSAEQGKWIKWIPWSAVYLQHTPEFMYRAKSASYAKRLFQLLEVKDESECSRKFWERAPRLESLYSPGLWELPVHRDVIEKIGLG